MDPHEGEGIAMELTEDQRRFKEEYIRERGYWVSFNDGLLAHSPDFLKTYLRYAGVPARTGTLSPRIRELIYVAIDSSTTHMFAQGLAIHIRMALQCGCTSIELIEVMQLATTQGLDSVAVGVDLIVEEMDAAGILPPQLKMPETAEMLALKRAYVDQCGDWPGWCERLLRLAPEYFKEMTALLAAPSVTGALDHKTRSLISLALAAAPTHLDRDAMRAHIRRALRQGATVEELVEVMQLVAHLGIHACVIGVPLIMEAAS
jgi:alkylhydroperoxidase/carboxymuconolactone decarboxylase family protein YurZ